MKAKPTKPTKRKLIEEEEEQEQKMSGNLIDRGRFFFYVEYFSFFWGEGGWKGGYVTFSAPAIVIPTKKFCIFLCFLFGRVSRF